jgi:uncharacterized protein
MSERDRYEPGVPCWVDTGQADPRAAAGFYADLFGWELIGPGPMLGGGDYFVARLEGRDVAGVSSLPHDGALTVSSWNTYVSVRSADESAEKARSFGGAVLAGPFDAPPAGRMAVVSDPAGASLCVWEPDGRHGAQRINEPGAWAMSMLSTGALEESEAFYRALFGWEADRTQLGDDQVVLWRLPGYVGGEPQQPVPRDVVGVVAPNGDGPARWGVDFWVCDADAVAADAAERGGAVIAAPRELSGFRNAILADPEGAVFSVSQLLGRP